MPSIAANGPRRLSPLGRSVIIFSDPFIAHCTPARSEEDTKIHQALEWSINHSLLDACEDNRARSWGDPGIGEPRGGQGLERCFGGATLATRTTTPVCSTRN